MSDRVPPEPRQPRPPGLFESLRAMLASLVAIAHTRLDLFGTEVEEQVGRLASILIWGLVALFCAFLALLLGAVALIVVFWDTHRVAAALGLAAVAVALAVFAIHGFRARLRARPRLFQSTLDELSKDHERLSE